MRTACFVLFNKGSGKIYICLKDFCFFRKIHCCLSLQLVLGQSSHSMQVNEYKDKINK